MISRRFPAIGMIREFTMQTLDYSVNGADRSIPFRTPTFSDRALRGSVGSFERWSPALPETTASTFLKNKRSENPRLRRQQS